MNKSAPIHSHGYWRSLAEAAKDGAYIGQAHREFPVAASEWTSDLSRRHFLKIMGASVALAGFAGCTKQPVEKIVPYVSQPPELTPGKPLFFATGTTLNGFASGIIVTSHEGRPTKIEGNPDHPASGGATSIFAQASVLDLYDPDRAQTLLYAGEPANWGSFLSAMESAMVAQAAKQGAGLRILTGTVTSPSLFAQMHSLLSVYPGAKWHQWEPLTRDNVRDGASAAFGQIVEAQYHFDKADVVVALDSDFLSTHPAALRHARDFAARRRVGNTAPDSLNRLYVAEPTPSLTGAMADHRLSAAAADIALLARELAAKLGVGASANGSNEWVNAAADDLKKSRGRGLVVAGEQQPPEVHALAHAINHQLGNDGTTVVYTTPAEPVPTAQLESLKQLVSDLKSGAVDLLVMLGCNPVFDAPADIDIAGALPHAKLCVRLGLDENETSRYCHWHIPAAHELESWGDARSFDGAASIIQPLIEPLYGGKSALEVIEALLHQPGRTGYDIVRDYWHLQAPADFEKQWRTALSKGLVPAPQPAAVSPVAKPPAAPASLAKAGGLEIVFRPDPTIWDGRFANNAWLQELAKPFTKLTWDNAALVSPALAAREHLENGDMIQLRFKGRTLQAAAWILPGQAENSVTLHLGYGRTRVGSVGSGAGFNAYALRTSDALWFGNGLEIAKMGGTYPLSSTQRHFNIEGRDIVREGTLADFKADPHFIDAHEEPLPGANDTLYKPGEFPYTGYKWGLSIDLNTCIGCGACTIACQAENNIPVVGKYQVGKGREMQWIRVDDYFRGPAESPQVTHQPVPCMQCENAPCELVCPVGATVHDNEGLNVQVYNRCVGTRYCSNNCPYKVRRFNFLEFNAGMTAVQKMVKNPDVTVRSRGVMEKCTYCVQRINEARIAAELADRKIRDGEVVTACQAACPAQAIVFGDLNDPASRVSKLK
ncbi:MAG TPA: TAT-variant-translocated molybdopterin oxidoreductase, partial [Chthoniobacteraceae bacterium]|nr:TAT-variant-translocated molybdopterin oxidoreductase [Chthoniobacteraceae bacterium]